VIDWSVAAREDVLVVLKKQESHMPKKLILVFVALLIAGASFALGLLTNHSPSTQSLANNTTSPPRQDFDELLTPWQYPGAKLIHSARGGELAFCKDSLQLPMHVAFVH
jgi:hypothetical protein